MEINIVKNDGVITIALNGRLDTVTSQELAEKAPLSERDNLDVILDFKELQYISSAGLRLLIVFKKDADAKGKSLKIISANEITKEIFRVTGFDKLLNIE